LTVRSRSLLFASVLLVWTVSCDVNREDMAYAVTGNRLGGGTTDQGSTADPGSEGGTWYDPSSGLTWQNPPLDGTRIWSNAKSYCSGLTMDSGGWRLPTISELRSLIRGCTATQTGGSCGVTESCLSYGSCRDSSCSGCLYNGGPSEGCYWPDELEGPCSWYWSSSAAVDPIDRAWYVDFVSGFVDLVRIGAGSHVRCVR
jgi:hypothetical protein